MNTPNQRLLLLFFVAFFWSFIAKGQLSATHWISPVHSTEGAGVKQQFLYLSTPEAAAFQVTITDGAGNPIPGSPFTLSNANPVRIDLGTNAGTYVTTINTDLNKPLALNRGLILTASESFYANLRLADGAQGGNLSSKGRLGIGNEFRLGSFPQGGINHPTAIGFFASVMATEDNTMVTFDDYNTNVTFLDNVGVGSITDDVITTMILNAGESYVVAGKYDTTANLDGFIGARVRSNNPIAVNTGTMLGATTISGSSRDMGLDQIVASNLIGTEYIVIRGNGTNAMENVMVVATVDNTEIFVNGAAASIVTINAGEYYVVDAINYTGVTHQNMYIETSAPSYLYQILGGAAQENTQGMSFIPPLNCCLLYTSPSPRDRG